MVVGLAAAELAAEAEADSVAADPVAAILTPGNRKFRPCSALSFSERYE
jgi:hypothetical protein